jgi:hypothetical protein
MNSAEKLEWQTRARRLLRDPVPQSVMTGDARMATDYRNQCAVLSAFISSGKQPDRACLVVLRVEGMRGDRRVSGACDLPDGAARSATPPSNTGVNEGRMWLLGSGL